MSGDHRRRRTRPGDCERVATVVGDPSQVLAGTDCGFDTLAGWGRVTEDVVWAKLSSLRDGARLASGRLFLRGRWVRLSEAKPTA
jgi:methionine synthase II (cobalamin-independent)